MSNREPKWVKTQMSQWMMRTILKTTMTSPLLKNKDLHQQQQQQQQQHRGIIYNILKWDGIKY